MNLTTKPQSIKQISAKAKEIQTSYNALVDAGYVETMYPYMKDMRGIQSVINDLLVASESLEFAGYSEVWLNTVNADGNLFEFLNMSPSDFVGKSVKASQELFQQGFGATILEWLKKAWEWIVNTCQKITDFLIKSGWIGADKVKEDIDAMGKTAESVLKGFPGVVVIPRNQFVVNAPAVDTLRYRAEPIVAILDAIFKECRSIADGSKSMAQIINTTISSKWANVDTGIRAVNDDNVGISFTPMETIVYDFGVLMNQQNPQTVFSLMTINLNNAINTISHSTQVKNVLQRIISDSKSRLDSLKKKGGDALDIAEEQRYLGANQNLLKVINTCLNELDTCTRYISQYVDQGNKVLMWIKMNTK